MNRADLRFKLGQYQLAVEDYDEALQINSDMMMPLCNRGNAKIKLKLYQDAISDFRRAAVLDPDNSRVVRQIALCQYWVENYQEAIYYASQFLDSEFPRAEQSKKSELQ